MLLLLRQHNIITQKDHILLSKIYGDIMSKKIFSIILAVSLLVIIGIAPLFTLTESKDVVKIGVIIPLTGKLSYIGEAEMHGIELAIETVRVETGLDIEVIFEDSQGQPDQAVTAYHKLKTIDNIKYIIVAQSSSVFAVAPLAEEDKTVLLTISTLSPKISELGDYIFRHNLYPADDAEFLAESICTKLGHKKIGYIMEDTESAKTYFPVFKKKFKELGCSISIQEIYNTETMDFRTLLLKIKDSGVETVFAYSHAIETATMMKQSAEIGLELQWTSMFILEDQIVIDTAEKFAEGAIFSSMYNVDSKKTIVREFRDQYILKFGEKPITFSALAYDDILIYANAFSRCPDLTDTECVKDSMYQLEIEGVTGSIWFDEKGDSHKSLILKTIKDGEFVALE